MTLEELANHKLFCHMDSDFITVERLPTGSIGVFVYATKEKTSNPLILIFHDPEVLKKLQVAFSIV